MYDPLERNPLSLNPVAPEPVRPFNVVRSSDAPILTSTELTSHAYQRLLAGTPWEYYRLVVTQWPRLEGNQATPIPATAMTMPSTSRFIWEPRPTAIRRTTVSHAP